RLEAADLLLVRGAVRRGDRRIRGAARGLPALAGRGAGEGGARYAPLTRRARPAQYGSRSTRLRTLPLAVRGSSSRKSTDRGRSKPPSRGRQKSRISSSVARIPARSATTAFTASPQRGSGTPMTAASAI